MNKSRHGARRGGKQRTRQEHAEETAQDYVELIAELNAECGEARAIDLARRFSVTHVTVGKALQRLERLGLVRLAPYKAISLTVAGKRLASKAKHRHQVVLKFLLSIGVPVDVAESDAEGIEHHVSEETLGAMEKIIKKLEHRLERRL